MSHEFQPGDLVQLKSGGLPMTFRSRRDNGEVYVMYTTDSGLQHAILPIALLKSATDPAKDRPGTERDASLRLLVERSERERQVKAPSVGWDPYGDDL